jgi:hypothetical protein
MAKLMLVMNTLALMLLGGMFPAVSAPGRRAGPGLLLAQVLQLAADPGKLVFEVFQVVFQVPGAGPPAAPGMGRIGRAVLVTGVIAEAVMVRIPVSVTAAHANLLPMSSYGFTFYLLSLRLARGVSP